MMEVTGRIAILVACVAAVGCGQGESSERLDTVMQGIGGVPPTFCGLPAGGVDPTGVIVDAVADTQLEQAVPTTNEGNLETCTVKGGANQRHCLLRFDLASVAPSTQVLGGCLLLVVQDTSTANFKGYEVLRNWGHTTATWQRATTAVNWEVPGAWGATDSGSTVVATIPKNRSGWEMIPISKELVQNWVTNPGNNYGIVFGGSSSDGASFSTLEDPGNEPQLAVWTGP